MNSDSSHDNDDQDDDETTDDQEFDKAAKEDAEILAHLVKNETALKSGVRSSPKKPAPEETISKTTTHNLKDASPLVVEPKRFRVLTWNLQDYTGDQRPRRRGSLDSDANRARAKFVAEVMKREKVDLLCVLETGSDVSQALETIRETLEGKDRENWLPLTTELTFPTPPGKTKGCYADPAAVWRIHHTKGKHHKKHAPNALGFLTFYYTTSASKDDARKEKTDELKKRALDRLTEVRPVKMPPGSPPKSIEEWMARTKALFPGKGPTGKRLRVDFLSKLEKPYGQQHLNSLRERLTAWRKMGLDKLGDDWRLKHEQVRRCLEALEVLLTIEIWDASQEPKDLLQRINDSTVHRADKWATIICLLTLYDKLTLELRKPYEIYTQYEKNDREGASYLQALDEFEMIVRALAIVGDYKRPRAESYGALYHGPSGFLQPLTYQIARKSKTGGLIVNQNPRSGENWRSFLVLPIDVTKDRREHLCIFHAPSSKQTIKARTGAAQSAVEHCSSLGDHVTFLGDWNIPDDEKTKDFHQWLEKHGLKRLGLVNGEFCKTSLRTAKTMAAKGDIYSEPYDVVYVKNGRNDVDARFLRLDQIFTGIDIEDTEWQYLKISYLGFFSYLISIIERNSSYLFANISLELVKNPNAIEESVLKKNLQPLCDWWKNNGASLKCELEERRDALNKALGKSIDTSESKLLTDFKVQLDKIPSLLQNKVLTWTKLHTDVYQDSSKLPRVKTVATWVLEALEGLRNLEKDLDLRKQVAYRLVVSDHIPSLTTYTVDLKSTKKGS